MKTEIVVIPVADIDPNPFRMLGVYPYNEKKLETLQRSIEDVGLWEGIIGRWNGNRIEIAFGHHRHKAAMNVGKAEIPIIVRNLTDEQMLQFMGRENLEEYNADFLVMLETWEAGWKFPNASGSQREAIDVATLLGWTDIRSISGTPQLNQTARACHAAHALISAGHLNRADLADLSLKAVRDIVERTHTRVQQIDKWAKEQKVVPKVVEKQKEHLADAAKSVADKVRGGQIAHNDVRTQVDVEAFNRQIKQDRGIPNFSVYGETLADMVGKMLKNDAANERLVQIRDIVADLTNANDQRVVKRICFELEQLADRANEHKRTIATPKVATVTPLRALPSKED